MSLASRLFRPTCSNSRSASSALVRVMSPPCATQAGAKLCLGLPDERIDDRIHFGVFERATSILHRYPEGKALLVRIDALAMIDVEQGDLADLLGRRGTQHLEHPLDRN